RDAEGNQQKPEDDVSNKGESAAPAEEERRGNQGAAQHAINKAQGASALCKAGDGYGDNQCADEMVTVPKVAFVTEEYAAEHQADADKSTKAKGPGSGYISRALKARCRCGNCLLAIFRIHGSAEQENLKHGFAATFSFYQ